MAFLRAMYEFLMASMRDREVGEIRREALFGDADPGANVVAAWGDPGPRRGTRDERRTDDTAFSVAAPTLPCFRRAMAIR